MNWGASDQEEKTKEKYTSIATKQQDKQNEIQRIKRIK